MVAMRGRLAFTLVELVVALVLSAILMVAVFNSLRSSLLTASWAESKQASASSKQLLRELIRRDVSQAVGVRVASEGVALVGPLETNPATRLPTLRDAVVYYRLQRENGQRLLVRSEAAAVGPIRERQRDDVLWVGVERLDLQALSEADSGEEEGPAVEGLPAGFEPIATHVKVDLVGAGGRPLMSEVVMNHLEATP